MDPNTQELQKKQLELQIKQVVSTLLTKEARARLANIRTIKPDVASQLELQLFQISQSGAIKGQITDTELKNILKNIFKKKDTKLKFR